MSYRRLAAVVAFTGSFLFALLELAQTLFRSDHGFAVSMNHYALGRYGFLQTVAFVALGLASLALCAGLSPPTRPAPRWHAGRLLLATWSLGVLVAAAFPVDAGEASVAGQVHGAASGLSFLAVIAAMFVLGAAFADLASWASFSRRSTELAGVSAAAFLVAGATTGSLVFGVAQRVFVGAVAAWLMLTALRLTSMTRPTKDGGRNIDKLRGALSELNRGNFDDLSLLLHPRVRWYPVPGRGLDPCRDRDEVLATMRQHLDSGFRLVDVELLESGGEVVVGFRAPDHLPVPAGARFNRERRHPWTAPSCARRALHSGSPLGSSEDAAAFHDLVDLRSRLPSST